MVTENLLLHSVHPYPCKFPPQVVQMHLPEKGVVLDPYCGSGTTLLEAAYRGLDAVGIDCNPIATLISRCKLALLSESDHNDLVDTLNKLEKNLAELNFGDHHLHDFPGRDHWFESGVQAEIALVLNNAIGRFERESNKWIIMATALSSIVNTFSNQDSETRYVAVAKQFEVGDMVRAFIQKARKTLDAVVQRGPVSAACSVIDGDLRKMKELGRNCVDVVITSPPYANTMDYYLYHKQRMNVLGFDFREAQHSEIGSRYQFSSKKDTPQRWEEDYLDGMRSAMEILKPNGVAWFVIGDSQINGQLIDGGKLTVNAAQKLGLHAEIVESVPMAGKSRLFRSSFQRPNKFEHVVKLSK